MERGGRGLIFGPPGGAEQFADVSADLKEIVQIEGLQEVAVRLQAKCLRTVGRGSRGGKNCYRNIGEVRLFTNGGENIGPSSFRQIEVEDNQIGRGAAGVSGFGLHKPHRFRAVLKNGQLECQSGAGERVPDEVDIGGIIFREINPVSLSGRSQIRASSRSVLFAHQLLLFDAF